MREKLLDLMKNEGLKSSRLAEILEINPAGISHILAGRNKPGFDLLQKILLRFPRISPDWLLLNRGPMYREDESSGIESSSATTTEPQTQVPEPTASGDDLFATRPTPQSAGPTSATPLVSASSTAATESFLPKTSNRSATVKRVVIFYDDDSFEAYFPSAR